ncbi:hypothetical protein Amsp01_075700 [Amycolatopsis sp. NBRC 101858]|nr:hypothetical protein Amsp01_075700 [Amycolatopsis sp. NBRC 101858]
MKVPTCPWQPPSGTNPIDSYSGRPYVDAWSQVTRSPAAASACAVIARPSPRRSNRDATSTIEIDATASNDTSAAQAAKPGPSGASTPKTCPTSCSNAHFGGSRGHDRDSARSAHAGRSALPSVRISTDVAYATREVTCK